MSRAWELPAGVAAALLAAAALASTPALASGGSGGGGGGGGGGTTLSTGGITVTPGKIAIGATGTAVVTLAAAVTTATTITVSDDYQNSPAVATHPLSVTIPAGSRSATFSILGGDYPAPRSFLVHLSTSISGVAGQFYRTPQANTDIISITSASQSQSGDLRFTATSDTPSALLSASFNGRTVPLTSKGGGVWEGRGSGFTSGGDIVVQSNLLGCSAKNPLTPTGWHFC